MKSKLKLTIAAALAVACSALFSASPLRIRWTDQESRNWLAGKWAEHCKRYGALSNNVIFGYSINTNWSLAFLSDGTNTQNVELGFRDDGVVVWRTKPDVMH